MELRRAILLFAIVLGLAAVVTVLSSGGRRDDPAPATIDTPSREPSTSAVDAETTEPGVATVRIDASRAPARRTITAERATTIAVSTDEAGTVTIPALGLTENAEPGAPALLDVLPDEPSTDPLEVEFLGAGDQAARTIGRLTVRAADAAR